MASVYFADYQSSLKMQKKDEDYYCEDPISEGDILDSKISAMNYLLSNFICIPDGEFFLPSSHDYPIIKPT